MSAAQGFTAAVEFFHGDLRVLVAGQDTAQVVHPDNHNPLAITQALRKALPAGSGKLRLISIDCPDNTLTPDELAWSTLPTDALAARLGNVQVDKTADIDAIRAYIGQQMPQSEPPTSLIIAHDNQDRRGGVVRFYLLQGAVNAPHIPAVRMPVSRRRPLEYLQEFFAPEPISRTPVIQVAAIELYLQLHGLVNRLYLFSQDGFNPDVLSDGAFWAKALERESAGSLIGGSADSLVFLRGALATL